MKFNPLMPELFVTNFDKSLDFYTKGLGFKLEYQRSNPNFAFLSHNGAQLMIQELKHGEKEEQMLEKPFGRGINFEIDTPDLSTLIKSLYRYAYPLTRGIKEFWRNVGEGNKEYGSKEILVHDPDGYLLRFSQDLGERNSGKISTMNLGFNNNDNIVEIWTDGACINNGKENARAAWAFVSGKTEKAGLVEGKQTNNTAEGLAIYYALVWAAEKGYKKIKLYTDSQISLHGVNKHHSKVKVNREIFENIANVIDKNNLQIEYIKVLGHSGDPNNDRVDGLANNLARSG